MLAGIRWVIFVLLAGPTALVLLGNLMGLLGTLQSRKPISLIFPFVCGPICALAFLICPAPRVQVVAWLPLLLDVSLLALAWAILSGQVSGRGARSPSEKDV